MSLLLVSLYEFKQFLQIVLWIALPGTLIAISLTTYLHYRKKKRQANLDMGYPEDHGLQLVMASSTDKEPVGVLPDWLASSDPDNTSLLKKYEQEIRRYKENYSILEQDFRELEDRYADLRTKAYKTDKGEETSLIPQLQKEIKEHKKKITQLQQAALAGNDNESDPSLASLQTTIQQLQEELRILQQDKATQAEEVVRLERLLSNMEQSALAAREEAVHLQDCFNRQVEELGQQHQQELQELKGQANQEKATYEQTIQAGQGNDGSATDPALQTAALEHRIQELQQQLNQAEEEKKGLQSKLHEGDYLQDLAQEKKLQVDFLQNQLEQRIKNYHQLEHQAGETASQLRQLQTTVDNFDQRIHSLSTDLQQKQQEVAEWQSTAAASKKEQQQQQETLRTKIDQIGQLESNLQELQHQQEVFQSAIADKQDAMQLLQDHLLKEQQKATELENKLELSSQLLVRIYSELAKSLNAGWMQWHHGSGPVAALEPAKEEVTEG